MDVVLLLVDALSQLEGLTQEVSGLGQSLPELTSGTGIIFYGAWALFGYSGLKKVKGWVSAASSSQTNAVIENSGVSAEKGRTTVGTTSNTGQALKKGDHPAFTLPGFLPLSKGVREVSHNEIHSIELGVVLGFAIAWLASIGQQNIAVFLSVVFIGGALGYKRYRSKAFETVRSEPWYAVVAFAVGATLGWVVLTPNIADLSELSIPLDLSSLPF